MIDIIIIIILFNERMINIERFLYIIILSFSNADETELGFVFPVSDNQTALIMWDHCTFIYSNHVSPFSILLSAIPHLRMYQFLLPDEGIRSR